MMSNAAMRLGIEPAPKAAFFQGRSSA